MKNIKDLEIKDCKGYYYINNKEELKLLENYFLKNNIVENNVLTKHLPCIVSVEIRSEQIEYFNVEEKIYVTPIDNKELDLYKKLLSYFHSNINKNNLNICLCEGRHQISQTVDGAIFPNTINPLDIEGLEEIAKNKLQNCGRLNLYVTGLTVALISVLNVCKKLDIRVTLYHYNRDNNTYYTQEVK